MFSKIKNLVSGETWAGKNPPLAVPDTVATKDATFHRPTAAVYRVRRGMWVHVPQYGIGILTNVYEGGAGTVMLTDGDGINKIAISVSLVGVRQAKLAEIPPARRPDKTVAINLGYQ